MGIEYRAARTSKAKARSGGYWIVPPGETKKVRYQRVSNFISDIEDEYSKKNLKDRDFRYAGYGIAKNPGLAEQIRDLDIEDSEYTVKQRIYGVVAKAAREAGQWYKADWGTAIHAVTEDHDRGYNVFTKDPPGSTVEALETNEEWGALKILTSEWPRMRKDAEAYAALVEAYGIEYSRVEATVVLDNYQVAGTLDRLGTVTKFWKVPEFEGPCIGDVKSGSLDFGQLKMPMQFACYANGVLYDHETHERTDLGASKSKAFIIHLPLGAARATLVPLSLDQATRNLEVMHQLSKARKESDINAWAEYGVDEWLNEQITNITTEQELEALYRRTQAMWTDKHVELAKGKFNGSE